MNKITVVFIFLYFLNSNCNSQETKFISNDNPYSYEEYSVLKNNKKIKHGSYLVMSKYPIGSLSFDTIGNYDMGNKVGLWKIYYRSSNNIKMIGNYNNGKKDSTWIFYYPQDGYNPLATINTDQGTTVEILNDNPIVKQKGAYKNDLQVGIWDFYTPYDSLKLRYNFDNNSLLYPKCDNNFNCNPILFSDSLTLKEYLINETFDFYRLIDRIGAKMSLKESKMVLRFTIDEKSNIQGIELVENTVSNKQIFNRAFETTRKLNNIWLPKHINGIPCSSTKTISFILKVKDSYYSEIDEKHSSISHTKQLKFEIEVD